MISFNGLLSIYIYGVGQLKVIGLVNLTEVNKKGSVSLELNNYERIANNFSLSLSLLLMVIEFNRYNIIVSKMSNSDNHSSFHQRDKRKKEFHE